MTLDQVSIPRRRPRFQIYKLFGFDYAEVGKLKDQAVLLIEPAYREETSEETMHAMTLLVTAVLTILGLAMGALQYRDAKKKEFYATFWHRRMELYEQATDAAAAIANAQNLDAVKAERLRFWQLFFGPMSLVEDQGAKIGMEIFGGLLSGVEGSSANPSSLRQPAYLLAIALRESLARTWDRPFEFESLPHDANVKWSDGK